MNRDTLAGSTSIVVGQLRDFSPQNNFDAPRANLLAAPDRFGEDEQFVWRELI